LELKKLAAFLARHRLVALDTCVFIYAIEGDPRYQRAVAPILSWLTQPGNRGVTSTLTLTELLVEPYRKGDDHLVNLFYALLTTYPNLEWLPISLEVADIAADLRARSRLRTPDAIQAACAVKAQATGLVTNDSAFLRVTAFETIVLEEALG
jgi:predicted nucleic acid-binding protein